MSNSLPCRGRWASARWASRFAGDLPTERARVQAMRRAPFFFAYFWFSPTPGGWMNVRT